MSENGLKARRPRRFKRTADSPHAFPVAPNLLERDFAAERPDEKWGADLSHIWTREGWLCLAVVLDLFARRVAGWAVSDRLHKELALAALRRALAVRRPAAGLIHHSDRGSQCVGIRYAERLAEAGTEPSVGSVGDSCDNALAETINGLFKAEVTHRRSSWRRVEDVELATLHWVGWFNHRRLLEPIGNIPPAEAEGAHYAALEAVPIAAWDSNHPVSGIPGAVHSSIRDGAGDLVESCFPHRPERKKIAQQMG